MSSLAAHEVSVSIDGHQLLRDVSLHVDAGEWLGVIGPNGAGKSTLLRVLAGLIKFDGEVRIDGNDVRLLRPRARAQRVAFVSQTPVIPPGITVVDYVMLGRTPHLGLLGIEGRADHDAVSEVIDLLDLRGFGDRRVETLSGGERQRVLLARALAQQAPVLLLDEPTSALDIGHQQDALELVDRLRATRALTVVTTMHDLTLAGRYAERLLLLSRGAAVVTGTSHDVLTEEHIARHYGASVRILQDGHGLVVVPYRSVPPQHSIARQQQIARQQTHPETAP